MGNGECFVYLQLTMSNCACVRVVACMVVCKSVL